MRTRTFTPTNRAISAFTLIELLVVIAIIAILAAILFPVFAQARDKARQAACVSNTKQLGLAWMMYAQDYDETCVPYSSNGGSGGLVFHWPNLMQPYVKNRQIFLCPSNRDDILVGYTANGYLMTVWPNTPPVSAPRNLADIPLPAQSPVHVDGVGLSSANAALVFYANSLNNSAEIQGRWTTKENYQAGWSSGNFGFIEGGIHSGGASYSFADGHSKWFKGGKVKTNPPFPNYSRSKINPATIGLDYNGDGIVGTEGRLN